MPKYGVNHGDKLYLQWDPVFGLHHELNEDDIAMSETILSIWSSFIKTGVPQSDDFVWDSVSSERREYLRLNNTSRMERSDDYDAKMKFWKELFPC